MLRRYLLNPLLVFFVVLTILTSVGAFFPLNFGPYPSGYRDRSVATFFVCSYNHSLEVYFLTRPLTPRDPVGGVGSHDAGQDIEVNTIQYFHGFHYQHIDYINNSTGLVTIRGHDFTLAYWLIAILVAGLSLCLARPRVLLLRRRRQPDPEARPCPNCQYDLRASSGRCPECGTPIPGSPTPRPTWHEPPRP